MGATSGDTGAAAISACSRYSNIDVFVLYPHGRVTEVQRRQMTTSQAKNVHALAVETDFDGKYAIKVESDDLRNQKVKFIAANSINWARCMTQLVVIPFAYLRLKDTASSLSLYTFVELYIAN